MDDSMVVNWVEMTVGHLVLMMVAMMVDWKVVKMVVGKVEWLADWWDENLVE